MTMQLAIVCFVEMQSKMIMSVTQFCLSTQIRMTFHACATLLYDQHQQAPLPLPGRWAYGIVIDLALRDLNDWVTKLISLFQAYTFPRGVSTSYFDVFYSNRPGVWSSVNSISGSLTEYTLNNLVFEQNYNITIRPKVTYSACRYSSILGRYSPQVNATTMESGKSTGTVVIMNM